MEKRTASEIVMEAVANSDTVKIEDMEKLDIRDKLLFNHGNEGLHCPYCLLGMEHPENSESHLRKLVEESNFVKSNRASKLVEKIYYNEIASVEAITMYVHLSTVDGIIEAARSMIKVHPVIKLEFIAMLAEKD